MADGVGDHPRFTSWAGQTFPWGADGSSSAAFGGQVLDSVADGLRAFLQAGRWAPFRREPAVLGCSPWLSDPAVVDALLQYGDSCIVTNKPDPAQQNTGRDQELRRLQRDGPGFYLDALRRFDFLAPREDGQPAVLGPYGRTGGNTVGSVRVAGRAQQAGRVLPLVHAKLLVVGTVHVTDEHPAGYVDEWRVFRPERVWVGSANLTRNSRRSLEVGVWSDDAQLAEHVLQFLAELVAYSEPLGSTSAAPDPEYDSVTFDEVAMWEAAAGLFGEPGPDEDVPEEDPV